MNTEELSLSDRLAEAGQSHLLRWVDELAPAEREKLKKQIGLIDFPTITSLSNAQSSNTEEAAQEHKEMALRAKQPSNLVRLPVSDEQRAERLEAFQYGEQLLAAGKVGVILVAGGQGSRLGFSQPKGMFAIGPVSDRTLYQVLAEQLLARSRRAGTAIPYFIMTSEATHTETIQFFDEHNHFGLNPDDIFFFQQGFMPAVDADTGQILMTEKDQIAVSPNGHGGMLQALSGANLLKEMQSRNVEFLYYHQVDNPTAIVCDPEFLGLHAVQNSEYSTKVVAKVHPTEKMGVVVDVDGQTQIIEYSDLPADLADKTDENDSPLFWAGNTAIHIFNREFLERMTAMDDPLPFHQAHKKVAYLNNEGDHVSPESENAYKFERLIFDALTHARCALVVETDREREFNPVKNKEGNDSPETSRAALNRLSSNWLQEAGAEIAEGVEIEISPLFALDANEVKQQILPETKFTETTVLEEDSNDG
jgi:UDP-N-acetylglucosamine/UDP-N-acetylgalactosamine diphosphorylase